MELTLDTANLVELATQGKPVDFKESLTASLDAALTSTKNDLDAAVQANVMSGGGVENYAEVVGIVEDEAPAEDGGDTTDVDYTVAPITFL